MKLSIIMYHYVRKIRDSAFPNIKGLEVDRFRRQLDYFIKEFHIITTNDLIESIKYGAELPENACWLTFDDGYKDHINFVLPELKLRNIQGSFFPPARPIINKELLDVHAIHFILDRCTNNSILLSELKKQCLQHGITESHWEELWDANAIAARYDNNEVIFFKRMLQRELPFEIRHTITSELFYQYVGITEKEFSEELYMSSDELKILLSEGMYVGSHTFSHYWLDSMSRNEQAIEIDKSLKFLADIGALTSDWVMCYPYGAYNEDTLSLLKERDCVIGITSKVGISDLTVDDPLQLRRFDTNDFPQ